MIPNKATLLAWARDRMDLADVIESAHHTYINEVGPVTEAEQAGVVWRVATIRETVRALAITFGLEGL